MPIKVFFAVLGVAAAAFAHDELGLGEEWRIWAPRAEIRPIGIKTPDSALVLSGEGNPAAFGGWVKKIPGIEAGRWYRFEAQYKGEGLRKPWNQVLVRLEWKSAQGARVGDIEFAWREQPQAGWTEVWEEAQAPAGAAGAEFQLYLYDAEGGSVLFREAHVESAEAPPQRKVRLASLRYRPQNAAGGEANVRALVKVASEELKEADLIVFGEAITVVGSTKVYAEVAEAADGPSAKILGELARAKHAYVVAGILEREGNSIYNTAILLDRQGRLAGKYRKVYLPREEVERGLRPGSTFPVFETDFGKLGLMICYDVFFSEAAKSLAMAGAEVIAMPIWGGNEILAQARSVEGRLFLVASGYDHPTYIQDPNGQRLSEAPLNGSIAYAEVDLNRRYREAFLGDMKARRMRETRTEVNTPEARQVHH